MDIGKIEIFNDRLYLSHENKNQLPLFEIILYTNGEKQQKLSELLIANYKGELHGCNVN